MLMIVSVTDSNAQHAANIANGYGSVLGAYVAKLENVSNDPSVGPLVQVVAKASPATATASGYPTWMVVFAVLVRGTLTRRRGLIVPVAALAVASLAVLHSLIDFSLQIPGFAIVALALTGAGLAQSLPNPRDMNRQSPPSDC